MAVDRIEFNRARGYFFDLDIVGTNASNEITAIAATIRGINGSRTNAARRRWVVDYRLLADVNTLRSGLPDGWIVGPKSGDIEHVNIWPADISCPLTSARTPRICWGEGSSKWKLMPEAHRTLSGFLEVAREVLSGANLDSPAR
jgi:hypothetical protein